MFCAYTLNVVTAPSYTFTLQECQCFPLLRRCGSCGFTMVLVLLPALALAIGAAVGVLHACDGIDALAADAQRIKAGR